MRTLNAAAQMSHMNWLCPTQHVPLDNPPSFPPWISHQYKINTSTGHILSTINNTTYWTSDYGLVQNDKKKTHKE